MRYDYARRQNHPKQRTTQQISKMLLGGGLPRGEP